MAAMNYSTIAKYRIYAECTTPLHIGTAQGENNDVLLHPVTHKPFLPATGIAGVLRAASNTINGKTVTEELFGRSRFCENENAHEFSSRVRLSDGTFEVSTVKLEHRPRLKIDPETESVSSSKIGGSDRSSGHKFDMEYVGAGAGFVFDLYLYGENGSEEIEKILSQMKNGYIQIGGQKSNGNGFFSLKKVEYRKFDLTKENDRADWMNEDKLPSSSYSNILGDIKAESDSPIEYKIIFEGKTEGAMLVKGAAVTEYGAGAPDSENMVNALGECIVPGSSMKGALRSRMEYICSVLDKPELIGKIFGMTADKNKRGSCGCISFKDAVIGNAKDNALAPIHHMIHIDKFTGGVINGGLFSEKEAYGNISFEICINKCQFSKQAAGLVLIALRDVAAGIQNFGSGYSIGNGFIKAEKATVCIPDKAQEGTIDFAEGKISDPFNIIDDCIKALKSGGEVA